MQKQIIVDSNSLIKHGSWQIKLAPLKELPPSCALTIKEGTRHFKVFIDCIYSEGARLSLVIT